jgi:Tfp pilus assembly protein PilF
MFKRIAFIGLGLAFVFMLSLKLTADDKKSMPQEMIERRQKAEIMGFFLKDPKDAQMPGTTLSIQLLNQAIDYYQRNEYELAKQTVLDAIKNDSQNAFAYELLGDIYNNQQSLKDAKEQYEIAYNLQPTESLKQKLQKLGTETKVDKKLSTRRAFHY